MASIIVTAVLLSWRRYCDDFVVSYVCVCLYGYVGGRRGVWVCLLLF